MFAFSWGRARTLIQLLLFGVWVRWFALDAETLVKVSDAAMVLATGYFAGIGLAGWCEDGP